MTPRAHMPHSAGLREISDKIKLILGVGSLVAILLVAAGFHHLARAQTASRNDVQGIVSKLPDECQSLMELKFRARLVDEGRPLTRGEVTDLAKDVRNCDLINDQIDGLKK